MNIDKAIEVKEQYHEKYRVHMLSKEREADQLSIEALKQVKESRFDPSTWTPQTLPGETKD